MNGKKIAVLIMVMVIVLLTVLPAWADLTQSFAGIGQRLSETQTSIKVDLAILRKDGWLVTGLKTTNFKCYSKMGMGLEDPGTFTFTVTENAAFPGTYVMEIAPDQGNAWSAAIYKFGFVVTKDVAHNGIGQVLVYNAVAAATSSLSLTPEQKTQVLKLVSPPK
jgi:hypothetical protein